MEQSRHKIQILDFGLAQLLQSDGSVGEITSAGQLMGTFDYMVPEQGSRGQSVDVRTDIYSLGATLFKLLTGRPPLDCEAKLSPIEKLRALSEHHTLSILDLRTDLPMPLVRLLEGMLATKPAKRPQSAMEIAEAVEPFCNDSNLAELISEAQKKMATDDLHDSCLAHAAGPERAREEHRPNRGWMWTAITALAFLPIQASLADDLNIPIWINQREIELLGYSPDLQITLSLPPVSLRSALRLMLEPHDLTYVVRNEVLEITSLDSAYQHVVNVGDTLAIYVEQIIPLNIVKEPPPTTPVFQAGNRPPVQGLPFRVNESGDIALPLIGSLKVADKSLAEIRAAIKQAYVDAKIVAETTHRKVVVSVDFLQRAGELLEVRNLTQSEPGSAKRE